MYSVIGRADFFGDYLEAQFSAYRGAYDAVLSVEVVDSLSPYFFQLPRLLLFTTKRPLSLATQSQCNPDTDQIGAAVLQQLPIEEVDCVLDIFMSGHFPVCWLISSAVGNSDFSGSTQLFFNLPEASPRSQTRLMINSPLKAFLLDVSKAYDKVWYEGLL